MKTTRNNKPNNKKATKGQSFQAKFRELQANKKKAFVPFTVICDPTPKLSIEIIKTFIDAGADILELGIPFSDPTADGPTIQEADQRALKNGSMKDIFEVLKAVREYSDIPISILTYFNPVFRYGVDKFYKKMAEISIQGVLVADLPLEESTEVCRSARKNGVDPVFLVHERSSKSRLEKIAKQARGYFYMVTTPGTTGGKVAIPATLKQTINRIKNVSKLPILVGFGISTPEQVKQINKLGADGVIVGSKLVEVIKAQHSKPKVMHKSLTDLIHRLKN